MEGWCRVISCWTSDFRANYQHGKKIGCYLQESKSEFFGFFWSIQVIRCLRWREMVDDDREEGEIEREIELGMKKMRERLMETQEHDEHIGKTNQKGNQTFYQKQHPFFLLRFPFHRSKERRLRWGEASRRGGYVPRGWLDWPGWCFPCFRFVYESWPRNRLLDSYAGLGTFEESGTAVRWNLVPVLVVGIGSGFTLSSYCFSIP